MQSAGWESRDEGVNSFRDDEREERIVSAELGDEGVNVGQGEVDDGDRLRGRRVGNY